MPGDDFECVMTAVKGVQCLSKFYALLVFSGTISDSERLHWSRRRRRWFWLHGCRDDAQCWRCRGIIAFATNALRSLHWHSVPLSAVVAEWAEFAYLEGSSDIEDNWNLVARKKREKFTDYFQVKWSAITCKSRCSGLVLYHIVRESFFKCLLGFQKTVFRSEML